MDDAKLALEKRDIIIEVARDGAMDRLKWRMSVNGCVLTSMWMVIFDLTPDLKCVLWAIGRNL